MVSSTSTKLNVYAHNVIFVSPEGWISSWKLGYLMANVLDRRSSTPADLEGHRVVYIIQDRCTQI